MLVPLEKPEFSVRFADEDKIPLELFLSEKTEHEQAWKKFDAASNAMSRALTDYIKSMEQVVRGIEDTASKLERNRNLIDDNNGFGVANEIVNSKKNVKLFEQLIDLAKKFKIQIFK